MRILRPIIQTFVRAVRGRRHDLAMGGGITADLIGDHPAGAALLLQQTLQQTLGRLGVAARLDDVIEHVSS